MQALLELGQSVWLDYLRRGMFRSGELQELIDDGLRGMTSNPTIFEHAIGGSSDYDDELMTLATVPEERPGDLRAARRGRRSPGRGPLPAGVRRHRGAGRLRVARGLAHARPRHRGDDRRGAAAVVGGGPAQPDDQGARHQGRLAGDRAAPRGGHQHQHHVAVLAGALPRGGGSLRPRARGPAARGAADRSARVGRLVLREPGGHRDRSPHRRQRRRRCSISAARSRSPTRAWPTPGFATICRARRWKRLAAAGARPQRLLWASTGTKDPRYSDVLYVDSLIGPDTINTMPPATLRLFEDHGTVRAHAARRMPARPTCVLERLAAGGVDLADVTRVLEDDGIEKFAKSFEALLGVIRTKRQALAAQAPPGHSAVFPVVDARVAQPARRHGCGAGSQAHLGPRSDGVDRRPRARRRSAIDSAGSPWARRWPSR